MDFCDDPQCFNKTVTAKARSYLENDHVCSHDIVKVRTVHHFRDMHAMDQNARIALKTARVLLGMDDDDDKQTLSDTPVSTDHFCACRNLLFARTTRKDQARETSESDVSDSADVVDLQQIWQTDFSGLPKSLRSNIVVNKQRCDTCGIAINQRCWFCVDCYMNGEALSFR